MKKKILKLALLSVCIGWTSSNVCAEEHYLVGGNTASGWNSGEWQRSPVAMVNVSENIWIWCGRLTVGDYDNDNNRFKIPNTADQWDGYWAPNQNTVLTSNWSDLSTDGTDDKKFCVATAGIYKVTINTSTLKIKAELLTAPSQDGEYYLIDNINDYYWYAGNVTSSGDALKARLTADLNFETDGFFPLSCDRYKFKGEFDGAGHTMNNMVIIGSNNNVGFIRYATDGANIHDLVTEGSFTGTAKIGGVIGFVRDGGEVILTNVINKASVQATGETDANAGGLVGCATANTILTVTNCANMGEVHGQDGQCAAFAGWTQSRTVDDVVFKTTFTNCWNSGTIYNMDSDRNLYRNPDAVTETNCYDVEGTAFYTQGTKLAPSSKASGELCWKLNHNESQNINQSAWHQIIGTDTHPVPFTSGHNTVYNTGNLYNNHFQDADYVNITSPADLVAFANAVNKADYFNVQAKLSSNLDMTNESANFPCIGSVDHPFCGVFDGQNHVISNLNLDLPQNGVGLFGSITGPHSDDYSTSTVIKNITIDNTCSFKGVQGVAGIAGRCVVNGNNPCGVQFLQCGNEASVTATTSNAGGILGVNVYYKETYNYVRMMLANCYNTGSVKGYESGAISGWLGDNEVKMINCYNTGTTEGDKSDSFARWNGTIFLKDNCFSSYSNTDHITATASENFTDGTVFAALHNHINNTYDVDGSVWKMEFEGTRHPVLYAGPVGLAEDFPNIIETANDVDVTMYRTIKKDGWNTFCVPFSMNATQIASYFGDNTVVAQLMENAPDDDVLHFETVSTITAGKAYLVYPGVNDDFTSKAITDVDITKTLPDVVTEQAGFAFIGVFQPAPLTPNEDRIVAFGNKIVKTTGGGLKAFRAYFHPTNSNARATSFVVDDGAATGIITAEGEVLEDGPVYNLNGQRVGQAARGIYIMNGKKVVMK